MEVTQERLIEIILEELAGLHPKNPAKGASTVTAEALITEQAMDKRDEPATPLVKDAPDIRPGANAPACKKAHVSAEALRGMQSATAARIGIGRAGARLRTETLLQFRADHAAARDAVLDEVDPAFLESLGLFSVQSRCQDKNEYLTRPDLGRLIDPEDEKLLLERCTRQPQVQIFAAGGLSSVSMGANLENILPVLTDALTQKQIKVGTPFYAKLARVGFEDAVSELLEAEVVCVLIGERPGLMTAESMSAYIAYRATPNMPESRRTVVSNIHRGGTNAVEAGAYIADIISRILETKTSGVDLKR